ncbi:MAG: peptidylprolyl isomerase [Bacteroidetes bacterium]|nr:peptidylprolyl isomerase [Bacteroidota bacterium]
MKRTYLIPIFFLFVITATVLPQQTPVVKKISEIDKFVPDGIYADLNTNKGRITLSLYYQNVPMTVANFVGLAEGTIKNDALPEGKPYFNGSVWHRVVPGFVIQSGMPAVKDTLEGPGYEFPNEIFPGLSYNKAGILGMANAGPHTNGSQFFITLSDYPHLDGRYTIFGVVVEGMDIVNKIVQGDTIKSVTITRIGKDANNFMVTDESFKKMVDDAKEKVKMDNEKRMSDEIQALKNIMPNAAETASGIKYIIEKEGTDNKPYDGSILIVKYKGKFLLGTKEFASTKSDGKPDIIESPETFEYIVGKTKINPALDEILVDMKKGEKRKIIALSKGAYGEDVVLGKRSDGKKYVVIPPNTSLVYEIEILK